MTGSTAAGDTTVPLRLSDHDPAVAYFTGPGFGLPDAVFSNGFEDPPPQPAKPANVIIITPNKQDNRDRMKSLS